MQHEALLLLVVPPETNLGVTAEDTRKNYPFLHESECEILVRFVKAGATYETLRTLIAVSDPGSNVGPPSSVYWLALADAAESFLTEYLNAIAKLERDVLAEIEPPPITKIWFDILPQVETLEILLQFLQETYNSLNSPLIVENHIEDGSSVSLTGSAALLQRVYETSIRAAVLSGVRARPMFAMAAAVHEMLFSHLQAWMREGRVPLGGEDLFPAIATATAAQAEPDFTAAASTTQAQPPKAAGSPGQLPLYFPKALRENVFFIGRARIILKQKSGADAECSAEAAPAVPSTVWQRLYRSLVNPTAIFSIVEVEEVIDELHRDAAAKMWSRLTDLHLPRHLDALYHFALTGKGDLWTMFIDSTVTLVSATPRPINMTKELEGILTRSAAAAALPEEDEWLARVHLTWHAAPRSDAHLSTAIQFDYRVEQPLDVLLTEEAMHAYRRTFTSLLRVRWQQQELHAAWQLLTRFSKRTRKIPEPVQYACRFRNKIAGFVDVLQQHVQVEVVEVQYRKLRAALSDCSDFASAQQAHSSFLAALLSHTPAGHQRLQPPVDALLQLANVFCTALQSIAAASPTIDLQHLRQLEREFDRHYGLLYVLLSRMPAAWAVLLSGKMYNATRFLQAGVLPAADIVA